LLWDWATILQRPDAPVDPSSTPAHCDLILFVGLNRWPVRLLREDHNNPKAKEVFQKLGSCDTLLNRVLRRIVAGEMSSTAGACMSLDDLAPVVNFLIGFLHCLAPLPWDRDIDSLVYRARSTTITEALVKGMMNEMAIMDRNLEQSTAVIQSTNKLLFLMDKWKDLHQESDKARW
jgi:hypothetical protein